MWQVFEMESKKLTSKEKRAASDARIIASAIRCFGALGYANTTMVEIAKGADVTSGLLVQRYGTKENLFFEAYKSISVKFNAYLNTEYDTKQYLVETVHKIKDMRTNNPDVFNLMKLLISSTDFPDVYKVDLFEEFRNSIAYRNLQKSQEEGVLPKCELITLMYAFCTLIFNQCDICAKAGIDFPDDHVFLDSIQFVDVEELTNKRLNEKVTKAILASLDMFTHIWIYENKAKRMAQLDYHGPSLDTDDARGEIEKLISSTVSSKDSEGVRRFLDFSTLDERLVDKRELFHDYIDVSGNCVRQSLIPVERDESGRVTEIIIGAKIIEKASSTLMVRV